MSSSRCENCGLGFHISELTGIENSETNETTFLCEKCMAKYDEKADLLDKYLEEHPI